MRRPNRLLGLSLAALAAILIGIFAASIQRTSQVLTLSDGSKLKMTTWAQGSQLRIFRGSWWQRIVFQCFGTNLPARVRGNTSVFPSLYTNGSLGLVFTHFVEGGPLQDALNGLAQLTGIGPDGKAILGQIRGVNFNTAKVEGGEKVVAEEILWEFPLLTQKEIRFRLYETNGLSNAVVTNEFLMRNPSR